MNLANKITILRILLIPFFVASILYSNWEMALFIFILAAISDGVDGYIARTTKQRTELGKVLDPIADKMLILSAFICLSVARDLPDAVKPPMYVPIIIISRDALIVLGVIVINFIKGDVKIEPSAISKVTTFFQLATVVSILLRLGISALLWNIAVGFTIASGVDYLLRGSRLLNGK